MIIITTDSEIKEFIQDSENSENFFDRFDKYQCTFVDSPKERRTYLEEYIQFCQELILRIMLSDKYFP